MGKKVFIVEEQYYWAGNFGDPEFAYEPVGIYSSKFLAESNITEALQGEENFFLAPSYYGAEPTPKKRFHIIEKELDALIKRK